MLLMNPGCKPEYFNDTGTFRLNFPLGIETLEPVMSNSPQTIWVLTSIMEPIVSYNSRNEIIPQLVKEWKISEDGLRYYFTLNTKIKFHDDKCFAEGKGRRINSSDIKYCLERVNDPGTKTRGLWVFRDKIKGAEEFFEAKKRKSGTNEIEGIKVTSDSTFIIELYKPFAPFLSLLTMSYAYIYPKEAVDYYGENFAMHPVGTGPFRFDGWELDKKLNLVRNPDYYEKDSAGNALPYLEKIEISFTKSVETEFLDFLNRRYDYHEPSSEIIEALTDEKGNMIKAEDKHYSLVKQPWLNTVYLIMIQNENLPAGKTSPFVNNRKLRQAINYAIDKQKIVRFVLRNRGSAAVNGPLPPGMPGYDTAVKGYRYDLNKARELLKEAGYPDGKGLNLTLVISNDELQKNIAIAVQEQLKDAGIDLQLEQVLQSALNTKQQDGEYVFTRGNWGADYFDPENFMALFYSKNIIPQGPNKTGYTNPEIDRLYEQSILETDFEKRKEIYNQMERIVIDDAAWIYLYYNQRIYLLQNNVKGFYLDGLNNIVLKYTRKR
ncbi:MAG: ABC transporter substrate-binding protein [Ignavibacteria bacterium]|nr:ABC transporter substrate-binding protein [Ignavibacteria bacterium]